MKKDKAMPGRLRCAVLAGAFALLGLTGTSFAEPVRIVALGDSNTYGYRVDRSGTYPSQMEAQLRQKGYDVTIVNAGRSGDMTAEGMARLDDAFDGGADAAIVFLGRNDWRKGVPASAIARNLDTIVGDLRARGMEVLLVGFEPNDFTEIAEKHGALYYPDFFDGTMTLGRKRGRYTVNGDIGRHLNAAGYAVVVGKMLPSVEQLIARTSD